MKKRALTIMTVISLLFSLWAGAPASLASAEEQQNAYVMSYHTSGTSGSNMTYMDDSLHLAYSYDQIHWTPLHDNNGILFKKNPGYRAPVAGGQQLRDPFLLRKSGGGFILLATVTSSAGATTSSSIFYWESDDLITYYNERTLQVNSSNLPAKAPQARFNQDTANYDLYWTTGSQVYSSTTSDFVTVSAPVPYSGTSYPSALPDMTYGPAKAVPGSVISVTPAELQRLLASLGTPLMPVGTSSVTVETSLGTMPALPSTGEVLYSDGTTESRGVTWEPVELEQVAKEGTFKVKGRIEGTPNYVNPLIKNGADPNITKGPDGKYYYTSSYMDASRNLLAAYQYDRITLRSADTIQGLAEAPEKQIFYKHTSGDMSYHIWAPELHYMDGSWYIYFAAGKSTAAFDLRVYVLKCTTDDPMTGDWVELGKVTMNDEAFDLDATVFEHNGEWYMIYAFANFGLQVNSSLRIAKMTSPTTLDSRQITIATPEYTWEQRNDNVEEGPDVIKRNGKIFVAYSAGSTDSTYAVGLLTAVDSPETDLLDPASWKKTPYPIMATAPQNKQFGPGHGTFVESEDGTQDVFVYHARENERYSGVNGYNPLYDASRWARVQHVYWHEDGTPYLGVPIPDGMLPGASLEATVKVIGSVGSVYLEEEQMTVERGATKAIVLKKSRGDGTGEDVSADAAYSSSAPSVATVSSSGVVTARSAGNSTITVFYAGSTYTVSVTVPEGVTNADLLLRYKFDETGGTQVEDASGRNNHGTYVRTPAFGAGVQGGSFVMSGGASNSTTAPYVKIPNGILNSTDNITISTYVKWTNTSTIHQWLFGLGVDSNKYLFATPRNSSTALYSAITVGSYQAEQGMRNSSILPGNVWKHLTITIDSSTQTSVMYLDGVEVVRNTGVTLKPSHLYDATKDYSGYIGKSFYGDPYFYGEVDDFRIYNKALTALEVKRLYEAANVAAVEADYAALTLGDVSAVTENLVLPTAGANGAVITWESSNIAVLEADGTVHRPASAAGAQSVILTALLKRGSIEDRKEFRVTVLPEAPPQSSWLTGPVSVGSGGVLDITYGLSSVTSTIYANDFTVLFNPDHLRFVKAEAVEGGLVIAGETEPGDTGKVRILLANTTGAQTIKESLELVKLQFEAIPASSASTSAIRLSDVITADENGTEAPWSTEAYEVQILAAADRTVLEQEIAAAQALYASAVEGEELGQYPVGSKALLHNAIVSAEAIASDPEATQDQLDTAVSQLKAAVAEFRSKVVTTRSGDQNGDGSFSVGDLAMAAGYYGRTSEDPSWNTVYKKADMNGDGRIDIVDLVEVAHLILQ